MKKEVKDFISNSYQMLRDKEEFDMVISQVLSFKNGDWYYVKKKCQLNRNFFYLTSTFEKC